MNILAHLEEGVISPKGFRGTGISCGLKNGGSKDISLLVSEEPCNVAMAFTKNKIQGAHIVVDKKRIHNKCQAILINSGIANCLTGQEGVDNAEQIIELTEKLLNINQGSCLLASTGVIGEQLNMSRIKYGIERLVNIIDSENNIRHFSSGIMTSNTRQKNTGYEFELSNTKVRIGISAKGESMIKPWLETMHGTLLTFITTDANISQDLLQKALEKSIAVSFNRMSIDNDTSPNDSVFLLANGCANNKAIYDENDPDYEIFVNVLEKGLIEIAQLLIKQGLGVTKLVTLKIIGSKTDEEADILIRAIAESYQVKTAFFGHKPSWNKIINVIGYSGVTFDLNTLVISLNEYKVFENGVPNNAEISSSFSEMHSIECTIEINLNIGTGKSHLWTCDLTHDYVKVNSHLSD